MFDEKIFVFQATFRRSYIEFKLKIVSITYGPVLIIQSLSLLQCICIMLHLVLSMSLLASSWQFTIIYEIVVDCWGIKAYTDCRPIKLSLILLWTTSLLVVAKMRVAETETNNCYCSKMDFSLTESSFIRHDSFVYDSTGLVEHRVTFTIKPIKTGTRLFTVWLCMSSWVSLQQHTCRADFEFESIVFVDSHAVEGLHFA